jgi:hypothetical protein
MPGAVTCSRTLPLTTSSSRKMDLESTKLLTLCTDPAQNRDLGFWRIGRRQVAEEPLESPPRNSQRRRPHDEAGSVHTKRFLESFLMRADQWGRSSSSDPIARVAGWFHEFLGFLNNLEVCTSAFWLVAPLCTTLKTLVFILSFRSSSDVA